MSDTSRGDLSTFRYCRLQIRHKIIVRQYAEDSLLQFHGNALTIVGSDIRGSKKCFKLSTYSTRLLG